MAFMKPVVENMEAFVLETTAGTVIVPADIIDSKEQSLYECGRYQQAFGLYLSGRESIFSITKKKGWFARLSASGYMDATDYIGPYDTENEALNELLRLYDVDENGDPTSDF